MVSYEEMILNEIKEITNYADKNKESTKKLITLTWVIAILTFIMTIVVSFQIMIFFS
jgi:hypothetical protein